MATTTIPEKTTSTRGRQRAENQASLVTRQEVARVEEEVAAILAPAAPAVLPKRKRLLASMIHPVLALWDELSGPPMTALQRHQRDLAEARNHRYPGMGGL